MRSNTTATPDKPTSAPDFKFAGLRGKLKVRAMPNPSSTYFKLQVTSAAMEKVNVRVVDIAGRVIEEKLNVTPNSTITLGEKYLPGVYITEFIQGKEKVDVKLIKIYR